MKNGLKIIVLPTTVIVLFLVFCSKWYCSIFTTSEEVLEMAMSYLRIVVFAFALIPLCLLLIGFVLGTGNTKYFFITFFVASVIEFVILFIMQANGNPPLYSLGISILAWYVTDIIFCLGYYFLKPWKQENVASCN
jgi:Na+-driven multidrug efflux pump